MKKRVVAFPGRGGAAEGTGERIESLGMNGRLSRIVT